MRYNDRVFIYHTMPDQRIMGVARVTREYYKAATNNYAVDLEAIKPLVSAVKLRQIKAEPRLSHLEMVNAEWISVTEIDPESWTLLCSMGGISPQV
jgi:predicted RNA-binding protein with PUA-like domain